MKDYSRKHYTDYQYRDWMRATPSKSIWNSILSQKVGLGEFSLNKFRKSSLSSSIAKYLKQSEFKKPYRNANFVEMEDIWEGPPGGFNYDPSEWTIPNFDQPWNMGQSDGPGKFLTIFDLEGEGCWCENETMSFEVSGTHPIYSLAISLQETGTVIYEIEGYGTNTVTGKIDAPNESGSVNFTASMRSFEGVSGSSNWLMYECYNCDECLLTVPLTAGSNPETISQSGSETILILDGLGPYAWSVTGSGFTLDDAVTAKDVRSNTLNASASACGNATVTVIDQCETTISFVVRCLDDSEWVQISTACTMGGAATEGDGETRIAGGFKQYQYWRAAGGSGCLHPVWHGDCDTYCGYTPRTECIIFDCAALTGNPGAYSAASPGCCNVPCLYTGSNPDVWGTQCKLFSNGGYIYYEWQCS